MICEGSLLVDVVLSPPQATTVDPTHGYDDSVAGNTQGTERRTINHGRMDPSYQYS